MNGPVTSPDPDLPPLVIVVMGVSGSGKTTIGELLAERLKWPYEDADKFHPPANVEKMAGGVPLTDDDRWPWLGEIAAWIADRLRTERHGVVSCSALKRSYRELLMPDPVRVRLVYLNGSQDLIAGRMRARKGHFFKPEMLASQFTALEPPEPDENALWVSIEQTPEQVVGEITERLGLEGD
jgi:gluconokinase